MDKLLDVKFDTDRALLGIGLVIFNSRYYGLPLPLIEEYRRLRESAGQATPDK
jgi:hypothetical protein